MRKTALLFIVSVALSANVFARQNTWTSALGNVSFTTDSTWTISGNGIFQVWSDAVQTDYCSNKTEFSGGGCGRPFRVDCRSNLGGKKGDLFSWKAVYELRKELCPYPWRVPTKQDFIDLDIALGGTGENRRGDVEFVDSKYLGRWGGSLSGNTIGNQGIAGSYWSQTKDAFGFAYNLSFSINGGFVSPQISTMKTNGFSLRCVRGS